MSIEILRRLSVVPEDLDAQPARPLTEAQIAFMLASETEEERAAQHAAARAAAEVEYRDSLHGRTETYREGDPPTAQELAVKVSGLLPAQELLVRFVAWRDQAKAELQRLTEARDHFYDIMGAPKVSQAELDGFIDQEQSGVLAWIRAGATKAKQYTVDSFRRAKLEEKLAEATHEAEIARAGLAGIDADIEFAEEVVRVLEKRHDEFVRATIQEAALGHVAEYNEAIHRLHGLIASLAGAGRITNTGRFPGRDTIEVRLPQFGSTTAQLVVERSEIDRAAKPWQELEKRLMADPRAVLSVEPA